MGHGATHSKASKALGLIERTTSYKTKEVLLRPYQTPARPPLEYCVSAWSPYYIKDNILLQRIQQSEWLGDLSSCLTNIGLNIRVYIDTGGTTKSCRSAGNIQNF